MCTEISNGPTRPADVSLTGVGICAATGDSVDQRTSERAEVNVLDGEAIERENTMELGHAGRVQAHRSVFITPDCDRRLEKAMDHARPSRQMSDAHREP